MGVEPRLISSASLSPRLTTKYTVLLIFILIIVLPVYRIQNSPQTADYRQYILDHLAKYLDGNGVYTNTLYQNGTQEAVHSHWNFSQPCGRFPETEGILLVMKTGATEAFDKMPTQLLTSLQCLSDFLLFSDLEQQIGMYHIYDVLDRVQDTVKATHPAFALYHAQKNCPVSQKECTRDLDGGWDLDKYKFLNMIFRTWELRPGMEWYVFAEADTYIVWSNLVKFLRAKSAAGQHLYVGSVAQLNGFHFAHGGSGYVISGALIKNLVETKPEAVGEFDATADQICCGDVLVSKALDNIGVPVHQALPMFNGEKPNTIPYGPKSWCEPLITMHHVNSEEVSRTWQYEQTRTKSGPIQIRDMYDTFFAPNLLPLRTEWDNLSSDTCYIAPDVMSQLAAPSSDREQQKLDSRKTSIEKRAHTSAEACARVCETEGLDIDAEYLESLDAEDKGSHYIYTKYHEKVSKDPAFAGHRTCFQWQYSEGVCCTSKSFKLGVPKRKTDDKSMLTSGWFVEGIQDWIATKGQCKTGADWTDLICYGPHCQKGHPKT